MLEAAIVTSLSSHDAERPSLGDLGWRPTFDKLLSGDTRSSKSAAGGVINSPTIIVPKPQYPPSDFDDDMILAQNSFNHVSLVVSDNSVDHDEFNDSGSLDTLLSSTSCSTVTGTLQSSKLLTCSSGLGISGLMKKDGSGPFDGLGIVSIKSSAWRHDNLPRSEILQQFGDGINQSDSIQGINGRRPSSSTYDSSLDSEDFDPSLLAGTTGDTGISDVFLQQALLTFTQDPFHQLRHSISISDCENNNSWSELGLGLGDESTSTSTSMSELLANDNTYSAKDDSLSSMMSNYRRRRIPKLNTNFSSATISSELKRSSTIVIPKNNWRHRSSSWPSSTMDGTVATTPLPRCKWRL